MECHECVVIILFACLIDYWTGAWNVEWLCCADCYSQHGGVGFPRWHPHPQTSCAGWLCGELKHLWRQDSCLTFGSRDSISGYSAWLMIERSWVWVWEGVVGEFSSPGSTFCANSFWYPFHPCVTAVAHKRSWSFCQKCMWRVTAKPTCTLCICGFCMKCCDMVRGCMVYTEQAETAAVSHGTSHVTTKQCWKYTTSVDIQKYAIKGQLLI